MVWRVLFVLGLYRLGQGANLAYYMFGTNYGQVFTDLSGCDQTAVNGETSSKNKYDTTPTDRGAYFKYFSLALASFSSNRITLPPNDIVPLSFAYPGQFSISMWVMGVKNNYLFVAYSDDNNNVAITTCDTTTLCSCNFCFEVQIMVEGSSYTLDTPNDTFSLSKV